MTRQSVAVEPTQRDHRRAFRALAMRRGPFMTFLPILGLDAFIALNLATGRSIADQQPYTTLAVAANLVMAYVVAFHPFVSETLARRGSLLVEPGVVTVEEGALRLADGSNAAYRSHLASRDLDVIELVRGGRRVVLPIPARSWNDEEHRSSFLRELGALEPLTP